MQFFTLSSSASSSATEMPGKERSEKYRIIEKQNI
jgi:hypothetical protein